MRFLVDQVGQRIAVGNQVYPATVTIGSNIHFAFYDTNGALGNIHYLDRPGSLSDFTDPSPYQSYINTWMAAAEADSPPLQLADAIAIKAALLQAIFSSKRNSQTVLVSGTQWSNANTITCPGNDAGGFVVAGNTASLSNTSGYQWVITATAPAPNGVKSYWEIGVNDTYQTPTWWEQVGFMTSGAPLTSNMVNASGGWGFVGNGQKAHGGNYVNYGSQWNNNAIIGVALDLVNDACWFSLNGVWQGGATATEIANSTLTHAAYTGLTSVYYPAASTQSDPVIFTSYFSNFNYTPPTGFGPILPATFDTSDQSAATISAAAAATAAIANLATVPAATNINYTAQTTAYQNVALPGIPALVSSMSLASLSGSPVSLTGSQIAALAASIANKRNALAVAYASNLASLNACVSIAAVEAFDVTAGWPF